STQQLEAALWPENRPRTAATALHVYISRLRKHLEAGGCDSAPISTQPSGYLFCPDSYAMDHQALRQLTRQAEGAEPDGRTDEAVDLLERAFALRRGPALGDLRDIPSLNVIGRRLDEQLLVVYERKAELELRLGRHASLIPELLTMVEQNTMH